MLKRLRIRNFRGFDGLRIDELSGVNLFAGKNNSGKTSLLEAIFMLACCGNAQMAKNTNILRNIEQRSVQQEDPIWKQLFHGLKIGSPIEIAGVHTSQGKMNLEIVSKRQSTTEIPYDRTNGFSASKPYDEHSLTFRFNRANRKQVTSHIRWQGGGFEVEQPSTRVPFAAIILLSRMRSNVEDAVRLGQLRRQKKGDLVLKALQVIEPRLQSIEENSSTGVPKIWGDIGWSELIPLSVMGDGMGQIARFVLAIASAPGGLVLVDEFENGIHHSILPKVWRVVDEAAKEFRTQIFATTHSLECVIAAHDSLSENRFRLHRLEISDSTSRCITYETDAIDSAIRHNLEVR